MSSKSPRIGIVMDPIHSIKPYKDSTLAMMLAAQELGAVLFYMEPDDLYVEDGRACAMAAETAVFDNMTLWHHIGERRALPLANLDIILMRKDPPVDKRFIHTCYLLEQAAREGCRVLNDPSALVALNEKMFATHFPDLCPPTLISSDKEVLRGFLDHHEKIIVKLLDSMGGDGVFMVTKDDVNFEVIWEMETQRGTYPVVAQTFIPAIADGDKRVLVFDGEPYGHMLVRTPKEGSIRGNRAAGGSTEIKPLGAQDRAIAERVGKVLKEKRIVFAGLDIIGDRLIEINITSPTGLREVSKGAGEDVAKVLMKKILG